MTELILHHYELSVFSEILRLALGIKQLDWRSVEIPPMAPKPDLVPLTGGYRKTPVMQVGADIYCDTAICIELIEQTQPEPSLYPQPLGRAGAFAALWATGPLFMPAVGSTFASRHGEFPDDFWADRKSLFGMVPEHFSAHGGHPHAQYMAALARLDDALADGRSFLGGDHPGHADLGFYMTIRLPTVVEPGGGLPATLNRFPHIAAWFARVTAIGHGMPQDLAPADALTIARDAEPAVVEAIDDDSEFRLGDQVTVRTEDPGADRVAGTLVRLTPRDVAIIREDPLVGRVCVHFPRLGQIVERS